MFNSKHLLLHFLVLSLVLNLPQCFLNIFKFLLFFSKIISLSSLPLPHLVIISRGIVSTYFRARCLRPTFASSACFYTHRLQPHLLLMHTISSRIWLTISTHNMLLSFLACIRVHHLWAIVVAYAHDLLAHLLLALANACIHRSRICIYISLKYL